MNLSFWLINFDNHLESSSFGSIYIYMALHVSKTLIESLVFAQPGNRRPGEESDATNSSRETCSDSDSEYGTDRVTTSIQGSWNLKNSIGQGHSRLQGRKNAFMEPTVDGDDITNPPGRLVFEYFERELPFHREPLADKASVFFFIFLSISQL